MRGFLWDFRRTTCRNGGMTIKPSATRRIAAWVEGGVCPAMKGAVSDMYDTRTAC